METLLREAKEKHSEIPASLKEQIVLEHTPLIRYIVNRIAVRLPSHIDLDDLHNTGVIGLMDAIEKYDPEKNCKFKTYAEFRIKGAILDQLRSLDWVPRSVRQKSRKLEKAYGEVEQRLGRAATEDEVADSLGLEIDKFHGPHIEFTRNDHRRRHSAPGNRNDCFPTTVIGSAPVQTPSQCPAVAVDLIPGNVEAFFMRQTVGHVLPFCGGAI